MPAHTQGHHPGATTSEWPAPVPARRSTWSVHTAAREHPRSAHRRPRTLTRKGRLSDADINATRARSPPGRWRLTASPAQCFQPMPSIIRRARSLFTSSGGVLAHMGGLSCRTWPPRESTPARASVFGRERRSVRPAGLSYAATWPHDDEQRAITPAAIATRISRGDTRRASGRWLGSAGLGWRSSWIKQEGRRRRRRRSRPWSAARVVPPPQRRRRPPAGLRR